MYKTQEELDKEIKNLESVRKHCYNDWLYAHDTYHAKYQEIYRSQPPYPYCTADQAQRRAEEGSRYYKNRADELYKDLKKAETNKQELEELRYPERKYNRLIREKQLANTEKDLRELAKQFRNCNYSNSLELAKECEKSADNIVEEIKAAEVIERLKQKLIEEQKNEKQYNDLIAKEKKTSKEDGLKTLAEEFRTIGFYKDAETRAVKCEKRYQELKSERLQKEYDNASNELHKLSKHKVWKQSDLRNLASKYDKLSSAFKSIKGYKDAYDLECECRNKYNELIREAEFAKKRGCCISFSIFIIITLCVVEVFYSVFGISRRFNIYIDKHEFSNGMAAVSIGGLKNKTWGYIDESGHEVISCIYSNAKSFNSEGLAAVRSPGKSSNKVPKVEDRTPEVYNRWGLIDKKGNLVVPYKYRSISGFYSIGLAKVQRFNSRDARNDTYGFIDKSGNEIIPCVYMNAFVEGDIIRVDTGKRNGDRYEYFDKNGRRVNPK